MLAVTALVYNCSNTLKDLLLESTKFHSSICLGSWPQVAGNTLAVTSPPPRQSRAAPRTPRPLPRLNPSRVEGHGVLFCGAVALHSVL